MKIRHMELPSGTTEGIPLLINVTLSTEQAVAVFELIDDLREKILRHYSPQIQEYYRRNRVTLRQLVVNDRCIGAQTEQELDVVVPHQAPHNPA
jgi:hypothetical protein